MSKDIGLPEVEEFLRTVWKEVLPGDEPTDDSDFFEVGGDSIMAAIVTTRLSEFIGRQISPGEMFFHPTVKELALLAWEERQGGR